MSREEGVNKKELPKESQAEQETVGPTMLPAEKDTDNSANTFNALRIHGRKKKRLVIHKNITKSHVQAKHTQHCNNNVRIYIRN